MTRKSFCKKSNFYVAIHKFNAKIISRSFVKSPNFQHHNLKTQCENDPQTTTKKNQIFNVTIQKFNANLNIVIQKFNTKITSK